MKASRHFLYLLTLPAMTMLSVHPASAQDWLKVTQCDTVLVGGAQYGKITFDI